jgi:aspartyl-tRNA(Asn)/glutamyl-tRNA(Gln) amidotransferase subunit B
MNWEIVVGIETHAQLATRSKIFSGASTAFGAAPNTQASAVDIALPGVLPVLNRAAVECAVRFGLAVGGRINRRSIFARKNYFYPDLPKGYQISQYELPVVVGGAIEIAAGEAQKPVRLTRAHLEEDAGKSLHEDFHGMTGIDLNRAGTPLLEIVSEPELRGAAEAVAYARALHALVRWIGICDGNMQEGSFRCDANVSVRRAGDAVLGTRCEIKNLNSFRFMEQAIEYEARRQIGILEGGGRIEQETRLYDAERGETRAMRTKEDAQDYRYFPDPDLLPLVIGEAMIDGVRAAMPELPEARSARFVRDFGIAAGDARLLMADKALADFFESVAHCVADRKAAANWIKGEFSARLNAEGISADKARVAPQQVAALINLVGTGEINLGTAKKLFDEFWTVARTIGIPAYDEVRVRNEISELVKTRGLGQLSDTGALERLIDDVLAANPKSVAEFRAGREKALNALVGQVMKASGGKANAAQVNALLRRRLQD